MKLYLHLPLFLCIGMVAWMCGAFWALTGRYPNKWFAQFHPVPRLRWFGITCEWRKEVPLPIKKPLTFNLPFGLGGRRVASGPNQPQESYCAAEDPFNLLCYVQVNLQGRSVGLRLLEAAKNELKVNFDFLVEGNHPTMTEDAAQTFLDQWQRGLEGMPAGEKLTIECTSFASDDTRQAELEERCERTNNLLYALSRAQSKLVEQQKEQGLRSHRTIRVNCTYTPPKKERTSNDLVSKGLNWLATMFDWFRGQKEELDYQRLQKMLTLAYTEGYMRWNAVINDQMKLHAKIDDAEGLWQNDWSVFHYEKAPPIPQLLILDESGLRVVQNSATLTASELLSGEKGRKAAPHPGREWVHVKDNFVGFLEVGKFGTFNSPLEHIRYLWEPQLKTHNYRLVMTLWQDNTNLQKIQLERQTRNATEMSMKAIKGKSFDVNADERGKQSIAARRDIERGGKFIGYAGGIFLYRPNHQILEQDLKNLADGIPGTTEIETELAYPRWLQSLPINWTPLCHDFYSRKYVYKSNEATAMLPLLNTKRLHKRGIELIAREGGTPILFDPFKVLRLFFVATSRGGKSVVLGEFLVFCLIWSIPFVALDFPRPDGTSTFYDPIRLLEQCGEKCFYVDTFLHSNNLLEYPDYTGLSKAKEREQEILDFHINATATLVTGENQDENTKLNIKDLLTQSFPDFHAQPQIKQRYRAANAAGFGTPEWDDTPTLHDYLRFMELWLPEHLQRNALTVSPSLREAASQILERLRGTLRSPLGRAIGAPTSYRSDVLGLVFAMRNLNSDFEARIIVLSAISALLRRALGSRVSVCVLDELSILSKFASIMQHVGQFCANGHKWGCSVIMAAQEPKSLAQTAVSSLIFDNLLASVVGFIKESAINSVVNVLEFKRPLVAPYATDAYTPNPSNLSSSWCINLNGTHIECEYRASPLMLALMANNLDEADARRRFLEAYDDPTEAMIAFSQPYAQALQSGTSMDLLQPPVQHSKSKVELASCNSN